MGRENCIMCHFLGNEMYCDYYDVFYMKCEELQVCPDGLDDDDEEYDEDYFDEEYDDWSDVFEDNNHQNPNPMPPEKQIKCSFGIHHPAGQQCDCDKE